MKWIEPLEQDEWPHRELRLGFDTQARLLETVVLVFESGHEKVIRTRPARRQCWDCCRDRRLLPAAPERLVRHGDRLFKELR